MKHPDHRNLPYGRHSVGGEELAAVAGVLHGDWLTTGPAVVEFERKVADLTGAPNAISCTSGTAGLHLAAMALDLGPGTAAIVPTVTFLATANAVRLTGGEVVFADVDADTGLMTPATMEAAIREAARRGVRLRAVLPVHLTGQCCDMAAISALAKKHGLAVVEDAAHAIGSRYVDETGAHAPVGDCRLSDMTVFSTHPVKVVTTAEGGIVTAANAELAERLRMLRNHAMRREPEAMRNRDLARDADGRLNPWYYEMHELGLNYRLTDVQCAIGTVQLGKLESFVARRNELADRYDDLLRSLAAHVRPLARMPGRSAFHIYVVLIDFDRVGQSRAKVIHALRERGIQTQVHYIPVHEQPYYRERYGAAELPGSRAYYEQALTLPLFVGMTDADVDFVVGSLADVLGQGL